MPTEEQVASREFGVLLMFLYIVFVFVFVLGVIPAIMGVATVGIGPLYLYFDTPACRARKGKPCLW